MYLKELSRIIYTKGTASEKTRIIVKDFSLGHILWQGRAVDLWKWDKIEKWIVVEILINKNDTPAQDYNKGKIITVM